MAAAAKWLWENFDSEGYTMWFAKYKYNNELTKVFMTGNLIRGFFQRMEGVRKYCFGTALILGEEAKQELVTFWIVRGKSDKLPACVLEVEDVTLYDWRLADTKADKELIENYLAWEGPKIGKPVLEGRTFK